MQNYQETYYRNYPFWMTIEFLLKSARKYK